MPSAVAATTELLLKARAGDRAAFDRLYAQVCDELHTRGLISVSSG